MELMDISLDKFYKFVYKKMDSCIPERMLGEIAVTVRNTRGTTVIWIYNTTVV